jgi:hypothetical protein
MRPPQQSVLHGQVAMGVSASAITPEIEAPDSPIKGKVTSSGFPLQTADTKPKHSAALGGWAFGVSEYSKHAFRVNANLPCGRVRRPDNYGTTQRIRCRLALPSIALI